MVNSPVLDTYTATWIYVLDFIFTCLQCLNSCKISVFNVWTTAKSLLPSKNIFRSSICLCRKSSLSNSGTLVLETWFSYIYLTCIFISPSLSSNMFSRKSQTNRVINLIGDILILINRELAKGLHERIIKKNNISGMVGDIGSMKNV